MGNINKFSAKVYKSIARQYPDDANFVISPLSIASALAICHRGSSGKTLQSIEDVLEAAHSPSETTKEELERLISYTTNQYKGVTIRNANSLWIKDKLPVKKSFKNDCMSYFNSDVEFVDFQDSEIVKKINKWCSSKTEGLINSIINNIQDPNTLMLLVNAIYFDAVWQNKFEKESTKPGGFITDNGSTIECQFMNKSHMTHVYRDSYLTAIVLNYAENDFAMTVILPNKSKHLKEIENLFDSDYWDKINRKMCGGKINLFLPKFTISTEHNLSNILKNIGLSDLFESKRADFTNLFCNSKTETFFLSEIIHKVFVKCYEEGTTAAALTAATWLMGPEPPEKTIWVNRPFMFVIQSRTEEILFMGKVVKPE